MPIDTMHKEYEEAAPQVMQVRDCFEGPQAVKGKGDVYLPKLEGQTVTKYDAFKKRGYFLPAIKPTATALTGAIMRKEVVVSDDAAAVIYGDEGKSIDELASLSCIELFVAGRGGYLVEHNGVDPVIKFYNRESIVNWSDDFIVLKQAYETIDPKDPYNRASAVEYLELTLLDSVYTQRIWRQELNSKKFKIVKTITPSKRGEPLGYIPFVFFNTLSADTRSTPPVLLEMSDINLDHYRLATDERHGLHNTALPTMFLFGDIRDKENNPIKIVVGAGSANHIPSDEARVELLEFTGAGIGSIRKAMEDDVNQMASIGAKMFQNSANGVRAAETARIEQSGESATLSTVANSVEQALTMALQLARRWQDAPEDVSVKLNRDFLDVQLAAGDIKVLLESFLAGGISLDTFLYNLKKGEKLPKDIDIEDEKALIENRELGFE